MKKAILAAVIIALTVCLPLHAKVIGRIKLSLFDADLQYVIGEAPLGSDFRCELNNVTMAIGFKFPVMLGASLYEVSYNGSGYLFSSFLPLETIIPIYTWPSRLQMKDISDISVRSGLVFSVHWAWLVLEPEGRHLEARLEFLIPFIGIYAGTTYFYRESAAYSPNLTLGFRLGIMSLIWDSSPF
jgi:hypothetical protein